LLADFQQVRRAPDDRLLSLREASAYWGY
jgi:hypothetical protein